MGPAIFIPMAIGAVVRTGIGIAKGESFGDIAKGALVGAGIGAATGGLGSLISAGTSAATPVLETGATEAVSQGVGQAATQGIGPVASGAQYAQLLQQPLTQAPVGIGPVASGVEYANMVQPAPLMQDLNRLAAVSPQTSVSDIGSQTLVNKPLTIDQYNALNNATPMPTSTDGAIAPASFKSDVAVQNIDQPVSTQYERYLKALEDQNQMQKTKMYLEGAKAGVDTAQAATAEEPKQGGLAPMGYPQPVQLTGANTDLMAQLMALAGGR